MQNLNELNGLGRPLGGAKVQTLDPIFSPPMDRKWIKFGGKVDLGQPYVGSKAQSPPTPRAPPGIFGVFDHLGGGSPKYQTIFFPISRHGIFLSQTTRLWLISKNMGQIYQIRSVRGTRTPQSYPKIVFLRFSPFAKNS